MEEHCGGTLWNPSSLREPVISQNCGQGLSGGDRTVAIVALRRPLNSSVTMEPLRPRLSESALIVLGNTVLGNTVLGNTVLGNTVLSSVSGAVFDADCDSVSIARQHPVRPQPGPFSEPQW